MEQTFFSGIKEEPEDEFGVMEDSDIGGSNEYDIIIDSSDANDMQMWCHCKYLFGFPH